MTIHNLFTLGFIKRCIDSRMSEEEIKNLIKIGADLHPSISLSNKEFEKRGWVPAALMALASLLPFAYNIFSDWRNSKQQSTAVPQPTANPQSTGLVHNTPNFHSQNNQQTPAFQNVPVNLSQLNTQQNQSNYFGSNMMSGIGNIATGMSPVGNLMRSGFGGALDFSNFFSKNNPNQGNQTSPLGNQQLSTQPGGQQSSNPYLSTKAKGN